MATLGKPQRQHRISRLLEEQAVSSQAQLVELLAEPEVGAHPRDPRVAGEANDPAPIDDPDQPREPARALHLDPVVEHLDADVVAAQAVRAVDDRVDDVLDPGTSHAQNMIG